MACTSSYFLCARVPKSSKSQGGPPLPTRPSWERLVYYITHKEIGTEPTVKRNATVPKVSLGAVTKIRSWMMTNLKSWWKNIFTATFHRSEIKQALFPTVFSSIQTCSFSLIYSFPSLKLCSWWHYSADAGLQKACGCPFGSHMCMHLQKNACHRALEIRKAQSLSVLRQRHPGTVVFEPSKNIYAVCLQGFSNICLCSGLVLPKLKWTAAKMKGQLCVELWPRNPFVFIWSSSKEAKPSVVAIV